MGINVLRPAHRDGLLLGYIFCVNIYWLQQATTSKYYGSRKQFISSHTILIGVKFSQVRSRRSCAFVCGHVCAFECVCVCVCVWVNKNRFRRVSAVATCDHRWARRSGPDSADVVKPLAEKRCGVRHLHVLVNSNSVFSSKVIMSAAKKNISMNRTCE